MLNNTGFDLWADDYDKSVGLSDDDDTYPFAGYRAILNTIYNRVLTSRAKTVLDIGFGTGTLAARLYSHGCTIFGQDFSPRMLELAQEKMPDAKLCPGDFSDGLAHPLTAHAYDAIISTYSLHHLTDRQKVSFLRELLPLLNKGGCIYIGDVAFETRAELERCMREVGDEWDDEEVYFVFDELKTLLPGLQFEKMSPCAGLLTLRSSM